MSENLFLQPNNQLGQFLQQPLFKRLGLMLVLGLLCVSYPSYFALQTYQEVEQQAEKLKQQVDNLQHQQRLLTSLKQKQQQQLLTPEIATQLANINRTLQQRLSVQQIRSSQWRFEQSPILQLQLESSFAQLVEFLQHFLSSHSILLLTLEIEKGQENHRTVVTDLLLQLEPHQEKEK